MPYSGKCMYDYRIAGSVYEGKVDCNIGDMIKIPGTDITVSCPSSRDDPLASGYCDYYSNDDPLNSDLLNDNPPTKSILLGFGISLLLIIIIVVILFILSKKGKKK